jgi:hypothetical protein
MDIPCLAVIGGGWDGDRGGPPCNSKHSCLVNESGKEVVGSFNRGISDLGGRGCLRVSIRSPCWSFLNINNFIVIAVNPGTCGRPMSTRFRSYCR